MAKSIRTKNWANILARVASGVSKTKISKEDVEETAKQAANNAKLLLSCPGPHSFVSTEPGKNSRRYVCTRCGGKLDVHAKIWYERGLEHGRKET